MTIQLDPVTKLPIWPGGIVPAHPRDAQGNPILPKPVWTPPLETPPTMVRSDDPPHDVLQEFRERIQALQQENNELLQAMQREINELKARVNHVSST